MRKLVNKSLVFISVLLLVALAACSNSTDTSGKDDSSKDGGASKTVKAKIGVISYLSGPGAAYGEAITNGFKLAQKEINEKGRG